MTARVRYADVLRIAGPALLVTAALGRLPFAMNVIGVLTVLTVATGSVATASVGSAVFGIAVALGAPFIGWLADRWSQRAVLLLIVPIHAATLSALAVGAVGAWRWEALLGLCVVAGATSPQLAPLMRARWIRLLRDREGSVPVAMAYESLLDELTFVAGPLVVAVVASSFGAPVVLWVSATTTAVVALAFALNGRGAPRAHPAALLRDEIGIGHRPSTVLVIAGMLLIGMTFGLTLAVVTAFAQSSGSVESAGFAYASLSVAAGATALLTPLAGRRFSTTQRWFAGALAIGTGLIALTFAADWLMIVASLMVIGAGVGVNLVTIYARAGEITPTRRTAMMMTVLGGVTALGGATGVAVGGQLSVGSDPLLIVVGGVVLAVASVVVPILHIRAAAESSRP